MLKKRIKTPGYNGARSSDLWIDTTSDYQVEIIAAGDQILSNTSVDQLIQAMAAFDAPVAGEITLSLEERDQLDSTIASAWV